MKSKKKSSSEQRLLRRVVITVCSFFLTIGLLAIVPDLGDQIKFSHKNHLEMEFECLTCHGNVEESTSGKDNNLPDMDVCSACHDGDTASDECETCHTDPDNAGTYPRVVSYHEAFAHKNHLSRNIECTTCHYGLNEVDLATVDNLPRMSVCMTCHKSDFQPSSCEQCHEDYTKLRPETHSGTWMTTHRDYAKLDQESCTDCHTQDYCQSCHQGDNLSGMTHDLNYMFNHSLDARAKENQCSSCHESRNFCADCHRENMVMPLSHAKVNWSNPIPNEGGRHKIEARMDLESCAACHEAGEEEPVCARCHRR